MGEGANLPAFRRRHASIDVEALLSAYERDTLRGRYRLRAFHEHFGRRGADPGAPIPVGAGVVNEVQARRPWPDLKFGILADTMFEAALSHYRATDRGAWTTDIARALAPGPREYLAEWRCGQLPLLPSPGG